MIANKFKILTLFSLLSCSCIYAETITILTEHLPPFQIVEHKSVTGAATEIVRKVFDGTSVNYSLESYSWAISYQRVLREPNSCLYSLARLPSREDLFSWIGWIADLETHLYSSAARDLQIESIQDAKNYRIAAIRDDATHHFLVEKGFVEGENLYVHQNYQTLSKLLHIESRNIDLVVLSESMLETRVHEERDISRLKKLLKIDELTLRFHLACNVNIAPELADRLRSSMQALENSGKLADIRKRWNVER